MRNSVSVFALAMAVTLAGSAANAAEIKKGEDTAQFSMVAGVSTKRMTQEQMAQIRGKVHVRDMLGRIGVSVPNVAFGVLAKAGAFKNDGDVINGLF